MGSASRVHTSGSSSEPGVPGPSLARGQLGWGAQVPTGVSLGPTPPPGAWLMETRAPAEPGPWRWSRGPSQLVGPWQNLGRFSGSAPAPPRKEVPVRLVQVLAHRR